LDSAEILPFAKGLKRFAVAEFFDPQNVALIKNHMSSGAIITPFGLGVRLCFFIVRKPFARLYGILR